MFSSVTIPLLAHLNLKCFLEKPMSPRNYIWICSMTMVSILIGLFGDICLAILKSSFIRLQNKSEVQNKTVLGRKYISFLACKICARKKLSSLFMSFLPFQNRNSLSYKYNKGNYGKSFTKSAHKLCWKMNTQMNHFPKSFFFFLFPSKKKPYLYFIISML